MDPTPEFLPAPTQAALQSCSGPLQLGPYVVMRQDVYEAMLGLSDDDASETLAAVQRGLAEVDAGRTHDADAALARLQSRYEV